MDGARDSGKNANHVLSTSGEREKGRGRLISAQITIYSCTNCIRNLNLAAEISKNDLMTAELTFCGEILTLRDYNCRARNSGRCWKISSIKILSYYFINGISAICKS